MPKRENIKMSKIINKVFIKAPMNIAVLTRPSRYSFFQGLKKVVKSSLNEKRWTKAKKINRKIFAKVTGASRNHHTKNSIGSLAKYRERAGVFIIEC